LTGYGQALVSVKIGKASIKIAVFLKTPKEKANI
jgi:hypothetical protein